MTHRGWSCRRGQFGVRMLLIASLLTMLIVAVAPVQAALSWTIETPDPNTKAVDTSLALDAAGHPHISYIDYDTNELMYAMYDGSSWTVSPLTPTGAHTFGTSLALDAAGNPHISYYDGGNHHLQYASFDGSDWSYETADPTSDDVGQYSSLAIDPSGNPHISYHDVTNGALKYTVRSGTTWTATTIASGGHTGWYTSLALEHGPNHYPHISYYDSADTSLNYAYYDGENWHSSVFDGGAPDTGRYTSLVLDGNDQPAIAYFNQSGGSLRYAQRTTTGWFYSIADKSSTEVGLSPSLALNSSGQPAISYYDAANFQLKYATSTDGIHWDLHVVDHDGIEGEYSSLAFDSSGNPHISYFSAKDLSLRYASASDDSTAPVVTPSAKNADDSDYTFGDWTNQAVTVSLPATDDASGVKYVSYRIDGGAPIIYYNPFSISEEGSHTIVYTAADNVENFTDSASVTVNIDLTAPTVSATATTGVDTPYTSSDWTNQDVTITLSGADTGGSSLDQLFYKVGADTPITYGTPFTISAEGTTSIEYWSTDTAGNESTHQAFIVNLDKTDPTISGAPTTSPNANGWYNGPVTIHWTCSDVLSTPLGCPSDGTISTEGTNQTLDGTATDGAGNSASATSTPPVNIDLTNPTVTYTGNKSSYGIDETINITCTASDNLSGVASTTCQNISVPASSLALGSYTYSAAATDKAGNTGNGSVTFTIAVTPDSLCTLTQQYVGNRREAQRLCSPLSLINLANAMHNPRLKASAVKSYLMLIQAQPNRTLSAQEKATLAQYARGL